MIPDRVRLLLWGFLLEELTLLEPGNYALPVMRALLHALDEIGHCRARRLWERRFPVFAGDSEDHFWIGIPPRTHSLAVAIIKEHLSGVASYVIMEMGTTPWIPLVPMFLYDYGRIGEYCWSRDLGRSVRDRRFDSGVLLEKRGWISEGDLGW